MTIDTATVVLVPVAGEDPQRFAALARANRLAGELHELREERDRLRNDAAGLTADLARVRWQRWTWATAGFAAGMAAAWLLRLAGGG